MTSARGQNVSVLQLLGPDPLEPPAGRTSQSSSFISLGKNGSMNGKSLSQHSLGSPSTGGGRNPLGDAFSPPGKANVNGSSHVTRELSPVRWCDREVDGVYLGRSGWVQVQQRCMEVSKGGGRGQNNLNNSGGLHTRKHFSGSGTNSLGRRDQNRPINLPLPSKRRANAGNHYSPSEFVEDVEPAATPSITPILSPPPAFRDEGMGIEVSVRSVKQPFEELRQFKSRFGPGAEDAPMLSSPVGLERRSMTSPGQKPHCYQFSQTKSLDENSLDGRARTDGHFVPGGPLNLLNFHSFDSDFRKSSNFPDFRFSEDSGCDKCERENGHEAPGPGPSLPKSSRQRKYQPNGKHAFGSDSVGGYRARSPSSDSTTSTSSEDSISDRCSQSSKRFGPRHGQKESLNGGKHFNVKRSRSLQLAEERMPREPTLMSHSSSGRSWDRVSPESPTFQGKGDSSNLQALRNLQNVMVTVNGQSIPVISPDDRSLNLLNKITTSEEEQKQLIREAEKEARVISEFLNGTRSRAAARNLLIHRYFNRPEPPPEINETVSPETESFFPRSLRRPHHKPPSWTPGNLPQDTQLLPSRHDDPPYSFPRLYPATTTPLEDFHPSGDYLPARQITDPRPNRAQPPPLQTSSLPHPAHKPRSKALKNRNSEKPARPHAPPHGRHPRGGAFQGSSSTSSSSEDLRGSDVAATRNGFGASDLSLDCLCLDALPPEEKAKTSRDLHARSASAPETDDCLSAAADHRSLSLPRSFPSDHHRLNYFSRRNSFPWRQDLPLTPPNGVTGEWTEKTPVSRTVPTTPVRDFRDERSAKPPNRVKRSRLSRMSLLNEPTTPRSHRMDTKAVERSLQNTPIFERRASQFSDCLSEPGPKNCQDFSLKFSRAKGSYRGSVNDSEKDSERNSHEATLPLETPLIYSLTAFKSDYKLPVKSLRQAATLSGTKKDRRLRNGGFCYDKYDSYDSGIQVGVRGNIDSSESQDTDLQEDADNLFLGSLHRGAKISGLINRKGVRRTKSDLGGQRLVTWDLRNHQERLCSNPSSLRGSTATGKPSSPEDPALASRSVKPPLRRSLSLNELLPFEKQKPSKPFTFSEDEKNLLGGTSDDDLLSDSESSLTSLNDRKKPSRPNDRQEPVIFAEAVWDHVAMEPFELPFRAGDVIEVLDTRDPNWWWGATETLCGYFPSAFVRLRVGQENSIEDCLAAATPTAFETSNKNRRSKSSLLTGEQVRSSVVRELLNTEREFVKILRDIKEGYILQCSRRPDMFTSAQIATIFSNLEDILVFQEQFLKDLERRIDHEFPHKSCVGEAFLNHSSGFRMYSEYCNAHPMAMATLQELHQKDNYCKFFEMCRLKQNLPEIPLDGYLLTPVQRICKYPLQLAELLKYTKPEHSDHGKVEKALETMRSVAVLINERKRKMESLEKLAAWQQRVEGWEGEDLIETSSQLIHQGDVVRITSGMWTTNITLFLFDHQIIYCKRDLLKRNHHIYKGRICLDESEVVDLPDGKNQQLGVTVKYGIRISGSGNEKWLVFCCRSSEEKMKWLEALSEERRVVAVDREVGLDLPATAKHLADLAARTKISSKPRGKNKMVSSYEEISQLRQGHVGSPKGKGGRRMGTWFTFGGVMKSPKAGLRHRGSLQQVT